MLANEGFSHEGRRLLPLAQAVALAILAVTVPARAGEFQGLEARWRF